ncbi:MAG: CopG family transcriptional regulator [Okeania sp. SIO2C9]|uniref:ribbon-helix-helix domain-containing protein n=1 Tax=Okeania sp. SIO2C9 TaxID=2607791 RepID=UPI0013C1F3A3|nr:CopG family transcriptional regulator [Okeania sp. SIO2C9]
MGRKIKYEQKKQQLNLTVTPETKELLAEIADALNISRSELIEKWARGWHQMQSVGLLGEFLTCFEKLSVTH